jgi:hypothetical protein
MRENVEIEYCPTDEMDGNYMTKPLQGKLFHQFKEQGIMECLGKGELVSGEELYGFILLRKDLFRLRKRRQECVGRKQTTRLTLRHYLNTHTDH